MKNTFINLASQFTTNTEIPEQFWQELTKNYTHKKRHYHTLSHLENMLRWADLYKTAIADWEAFVFAIFYHDVVYNVLKTDNEEQSARLAEKRLQQILFPEAQTAYCKHLILATKHHGISADDTTNLLIDIDLSVLGADWEAYQDYTRQIRKEYAIYPDLIYKPGRRKVLEKFLERDFIFKTADFRELFEKKARENLKKEMDGLTSTGVHRVHTSYFLKK